MRFADGQEVICASLALAGYVSGRWLIKENSPELLKGVGNLMMTDSIADFLIRIKNGYMAHLDQIEAPYSKMKSALAAVLAKEGYIGKIEIKDQKTTRSRIIVNLVYAGKKPKITQVVNVSTPGRRVYVGRNKIPKVLGGFGMTILTTPQGLMTGKVARQKGVGGEVLCKIW